MVSRIDIGPDGGPYVAINENSNDLELQDINGNVIAKWDETAGQWDLNNNSLTGINAINASSANVGSLSTEEASIEDQLNIGSEEEGEDPLTLVHPETGAEFEFRPDGTFDASTVEVTEALKGRGLDVADDPSAATVPLLWSNNDGNIALSNNTTTVDGDNEPTAILDEEETGTIQSPGGVFLVVTGRQVGDNPRFVSWVLFDTRSGHIQSETIGDAEESVSYSDGGFQLDVAIDDEGESYNVTVTAIHGDPAN